ncbi:MAG: single-stranded DNA exonuclease RecJ [Synergistales bacterium]|nr:single-stranded DNA exonuclease RecJ [Synergistales bacterium]
MLPVCPIDRVSMISVAPSAHELAQKIGCSDLVATVLTAMKFNRVEDMSRWINIDAKRDLVDVEIGPGSSETALEWRRSVPGKRVLVYGDYDVDGVASSALAVEMARYSGAISVHYFLPHRQKEGYGVHLNVIKKAVASGVQTLVVTDCGSKDVDSIGYALDNGLRVMVFDHHSVEGKVIDIEPFVNPQRGGDEEAKKLCATSVLWMWAFKEKLFPLDWLMDRLDLVALSTVGDCVGLGQVNRSLVREGLSVLRRTSRSGLVGLYDRLGLVRDDIDEESLSMKLVPCLNSAGRLDVADLSLSVVLTGDVNSVDRLDALNIKRKDMSQSIASSIAKRFEDSISHVIYDKAWPVGLLSAIASRLCSNYSSGFALAAPSGDLIRGSLRVPDGANAVEILSDLDHMLESWGGHPYAAGFSVSHSLWERLSSELDVRLRSIKVAEKEETVVDYDPRLFSVPIWNDLMRIGPFGQDNPFPLFFLPRMGMERVRSLGNGGIHAKISLGDVELLAFNGAQQHMSMDDILGWIYRPRLNRWRGKRELQFVIEKIVVS